MSGPSWCGQRVEASLKLFSLLSSLGVCIFYANSTKMEWGYSPSPLYRASGSLELCGLE